ncbi:Bro-N domain-containing protein [Candidatus Sodalis sp. SoCistrobi]|uniref:BRO-N domain-containing protein n=1 Tax=Candidatus Sodalis sp. SoCistrobi TaxID=1922216 RepID=UPI00093B979E|nr:Bro-N domain-containing protein [Candidatus Sodalis sp. SoCistrobi]
MTALAVTPFSFENHEVRTVVINGEPWFIASDVCSALKISNVSDALYKLDDDEKLYLGLTEAQKIDKMNNPEFIRE